MVCETAQSSDNFGSISDTAQFFVVLPQPSIQDPGASLCDFSRGNMPFYYFMGRETVIHCVVDVRDCIALRRTVKSVTGRTYIGPFPTTLL